MASRYICQDVYDIIFTVGMEIEIRVMSADDWESVRSIYLAGIVTGQATFESESPGWTNWDNTHVTAPRLVAISDEKTVGWAALSPVSARPVYAGVAEVSAYVDEEMRGRGIGASLLEALVTESEKNGLWTLQASIFPENVASISLHKACGFREVGTRRRIGKLKDVWRDTVLLERRSEAVGRD
jgi:L-amino acid N-acyltransferase YncA